MTEKVALARDEMSRQWHDSMSIWQNAPFYTFANLDDYYGFVAAKDWLQDTSEALISHRRRGFSSDPMVAYLEFWGVLQAAVVQQDAIRELSRVVTGKKLPKRDANSAWAEVRELRDLAVGHPARRDRGKPLARCVTSRRAKTYGRIELTVYEQGGNKRFEILDLGALLDRYDDEAAAELRSRTEVLGGSLASHHE